MATITSSTSNETLTGTASSDTYLFSDGYGVDTISDSGGTADKVDFSAFTGNLTINLVSGAGDEVSDGAGNTVNWSSSVIEYALGGSGHDDITGNTQANVLTGNGGNDTISGGAASDSITGGSGNDLLKGQGDNDIYFFSADWGNDTLDDDDSSNGQDRLDFTGITDSGVSLTVDLNYSSGSAEVTDGTNTLNFNDSSVEIENVYGGAGHDTITGNSLTNYLNGNDGNDTLLGGTGADTIIGGTGNDLLKGEANNDRYVFLSGWGNDTLDAEGSSNGSDTVDFSGIVSTALTINLNYHATNAEFTDGTNTVNFYDSTVALEHVVSGSGNDTITGNSLSNILNGADGNDTYCFLDGFGTDTINETAGSDTVDLSNVTSGVTINLVSNATAGNHEVVMGANNVNWTSDVIENATGGTVADSITGNSAANILSGNAGNDTIYGAGGADTLNGGNDADSLNGDDGNDTLNGGSGADTLYGNNDNDTLNGDAGNDTIYGGAGTDTINGGDDVDTLSGDDGNDTLYGGAGNDNLSGNNDNDTLNGNDGNDTINGHSGNDSLIGGSGADTLTGSSGNDTFSGGTGNDSMNGGDDDDTYIFEANWGQDIITEAQGTGGSDTLDFSSLSVNLDGKLWNSQGYVTDGTNNVDGLTDNQIEAVICGSGNDQMIGGYGNTVIYGNGGNDTLAGGGSNDTLDGGSGNDLYYITSLASTETIIDSSGTDTLSLNYPFAAMAVAYVINLNSDDSSGAYEAYSVSNTDRADWSGSVIENVIGGTNNDLIYGNASANDIQGNDGSDTIYGAAGNDTLSGGAGNDNISGEDGNDYIDAGSGNNYFSGGDGNDTLIGGSGTDTVSGGAGDDLLSSSSGIGYFHGDDGNDTVISGTGNDQLYGDTGNDSITAGSGNDQITGGSGNDTLDGGTGDDIYYFADSWGADLITDNSTDINQLNLSSVTSALTINLNSGAGNEVTDGTNTINWTGNLFTYVYSGSGNDTITGDSDVNALLGGGGNDIISAGDGNDVLNGEVGNDTLNGGNGNDKYVFYSGNFGSDMITDLSGTTDEIQLTSYNLSDVVTWSAVDSADGDSYVDQLLIDFGSGNTITVNHYFDNSSLDDDTSSAGTGCLEKLVFNDDSNVDFTQIQSLIA